MQLNPMLFLSKHLLDLEDSDVIELKAPVICAFTGIETMRAAPINKAISGNFTDWTYLRYKSNYISEEAYKCIKQTLPLPNGSVGDVRMYSFFADEDSLQVVEHSKRLEVLLADKKPPFLFVIGNLYASKAQKHIVYKSIVSTDAECFFVCTEAGNVAIEMPWVRSILPTLQAWYTCPIGSKSPYFTKQEILSGCKDVKKIEAYGVAKYFEQNAIIEPYRGTMRLDLLVNFLQISNND